MNDEDVVMAAKEIRNDLTRVLRCKGSPNPVPSHSVAAARIEYHNAAMLVFVNDSPPLINGPGGAREFVRSVLQNGVIPPLRHATTTEVGEAGLDTVIPPFGPSADF